MSIESGIIAAVSKFLKIGAVLAVVLGVLMVAAGFALRRALPPEKLRALVVEQAGKALKREVRLQGISVGLVRGAVIEGLEISADPDFKKGVFAAAKEIAVRPQLLPLLRGEVLVDQVSVDGLRLTVTRRKDGSWVVPGVAVSATTSPAPGKPSAAPSKLEVHRARLSGAEVTFVDELRGERWEVSGLDARVDGFGMDRPFQAAVSGRVKGKTGDRAVDGRLALDGRFDLAGGELLKASAKLKKLEVEESGILLKASGAASGEGPKADLKVEVEDEGVLALKGALKASAPGADGFSDADFDLASGKGLPVLLARLGVKGPFPIPPGLSVKGKARVSKDEALLSAFALSSDWGTVEGKGRASGLASAKPRAQGEASLNLALPSLSAAALPPGTLPAGLQGLPPLGLEGRVKVDGEDLAVESLKVKTPWGPATVDATVRSFQSAKPLPKGTAGFKLDLPAFSAADLPAGTLPAGLKVPPLALEGSARVDGDDAEVSALKIKTPWGPAQLDAAVRGLRSAKPVPEGAATFALDLPAWKSADLPFPGVPPGLSVPALKVEGGVRVAGEDLTVTGLKIKSPYGPAEIDGVVRAFRGAKPSPSGSASFTLDLPAWKSADLPFPGIPPGLEVPAAKLAGKVEGNLEEVKLRPLRVKVGTNDLEAEGSLKLKGAGSGALMLKCRAFVLEELTKFSPRTRELDLKGKGLFALAVTGTLAKPTLAGKLQFSGLGATAGGVELSDFGGTVSFDERRIDAPNIKGLLAGDQLSVDVTIRDYVRRPSIEVIADLVRLDLGKLLAAREALAKGAPSSGGAAKPSGEAPAAALPFDAKGRLTVGQVVHPNATASDCRASWELEGITPTFKDLSGWAKLSSGSGRFQDLGGLASQSKLLKVMVFPLMILQKIGIPGIFPNLDRLSYQEMGGDYVFQAGRMQLKDSHLYATDLRVDSVGSIDLPTERLDVTVTAQVGHVAPIDIGVTGTFAEPKAKAKVGKLATDVLKGLLKIPK